MNSSPPYIIKLQTRSSSPLEKCVSDPPFLPPGSPTTSGKRLSPVHNLMLPPAPGKGYNDNPAHTPGLSPNSGKSCDSPHPQGSPRLSGNPFSGLYNRSEIPFTTGPSPSPPPLPSPCQERCSFEPSSPLLFGRPYCFSGSPPLSPYLGRFSPMGSPPQRPRTFYLIRSPRSPHPCPRSAYIDLHASLCYCDGYLSALGTSPVTSPVLIRRSPETGPLTSPPLSHGTPETDAMISSPLTRPLTGTGPLTSTPLTHGPLQTDVMISSPHTQRHQGTDPTNSPLLTHVSPRTGPMISPPITHRPLGIGLIISPPLAHQAMETRPIVSPPLSHRVLETGPMIVTHQSLGRSYNDPPLSTTPPPPTVKFYHGCPKPPDSCEPKPHLDLLTGKNYCDFPPSQADISSSPSLPQEGSFHYFHLPPEAQIPAPGSPHCVIPIRPGSTSSPCPPQSQTPRKPCFESLLSWETGGSSCRFLTPGTMISGPPCPQESTISPLSQSPYSVLPFPLPLSNQLVSPPQLPSQRSYNEPPATTPVSPQVKSPKTELRQSHTPQRCSSMVIPPQCSSLGQPRPPKTYNSPPPPSGPASLSKPCKEPSITTPSNSCPKEQVGTALPTVVPRTLKTIIPTSLPLRIPCVPVSLNNYAQNIPHGPPVGPPCSTHVYSVVPPSPNPCLLGSVNHSTGPLQYHNQSMVTPCGANSIPRGPPPPHRPSVGPPCATHIYTFIPLRAPFDPQHLPIGPRAQGRPDIPCGIHIYSVASRDSRKEQPQVPYSCPLPSSKSSNCSTNIRCSSTVVISRSQNSDIHSKNTNQSRSRSQSKSPHQSRSRNQSKSPHQSINQGQTETVWSSKSLDQSKSSPFRRNEGQSENLHHSRSRSRSKSPNQSINQDQSGSPHHSRSWSRNKSSKDSKSQGQNKSPNESKSQGQSKSPHQNESPHYIDSKSQDQNKSLHHRKK